MATITVKNIPDNLYEEIKKRPSITDGVLTRRSSSALNQQQEENRLMWNCLINSPSSKGKNYLPHFEKELSLLKKVGRP